MAGIYFLIRAFKGVDFYKNSLGWFIWISFGALVKVTILPLAAGMMLCWALYLVINRRKIDFRIRPDLKIGIMLTAFILLCIINFSIYGVDLIKYRTLEPACDQVLTVEQCMHNGVYARNTQLDQQGLFTVSDIIQGKGSDPFVYFSDYWVASMLKRIYGIMGQTSFFPSNLVISFYRLLLIIAMLSTVRYWKLPSFPLASLYIVFTFYAIVLFTTNYRTEMRFEFQHVAVQGRYIFPVIGVAYTLLTKSILDISPSLARKLLVALVLILFLSTYLGMFLANYSSFFVNG